MSATITAPFTGTKEQEQKLKEIIAEHKTQQGSLMPVLQAAQNIYGYMPMEVQKMVAVGLDVPLTEVYGIATFYSQFTLTPKGKHQISVCLGTACYVKGAGKILDEFKKQLSIDVGECTPDGVFSLEPTRCIGACGLAPVLTVSGDVYGRVNVNNVEKEVSKILSKYRKGGEQA